MFKKKAQTGRRGSMDGAPRRRYSRDDSFTVGRAIAGSEHRSLTAMREREVASKRRRRWNFVKVTFVASILLAAILAVCSFAFDYQQQLLAEQAEREREAVTPTVPIDKPEGKELSTRQLEFIVQMEEDVHDEGYEIERVVLPAIDMTRQLYVYLVGHQEYYKVSIDRGTGVQAEDLGRMARFLEENAVQCSYVDLRVEGRAYYK